MGYQAYGSFNIAVSKWKQLIHALQGTLFFHADGLNLIPAKYNKRITLGQNIELDQLAFGIRDEFNLKSVTGVEVIEYDNYDDWELWTEIINKEYYTC